jgi:hypothetical protein
MAYFILGYFSTKLSTSVDGDEKIIIWKYHWNRQKNNGWRANIVQNLYYGKCTGKRDFSLQNFLFRQNMCRNLKFLTIGPVVFAPRTQTYATELKEGTICLSIPYSHHQLSHASMFAWPALVITISPAAWFHGSPSTCIGALPFLNVIWKSRK